MSAKRERTAGEPVALFAWRSDEQAGRDTIDADPQQAVQALRRFLRRGPHVAALRQAHLVVEYIAEQAVSWQPPELSAEGVALAIDFDAVVYDYHRAPEQGSKDPIPLITKTE